MSRWRQALALALFLMLTFAVAGIGGIWSAAGTSSPWYAALTKPPWQPPGWLFGPVWTLLYTLMAVAGWLVWRQGGWRGQAMPLALFTMQLGLNLGWTFIFFAQHALGFAAAEIALLWLLILATTLAFWRVERWAGGLFLPYLAWVSFASALTFWIWRHNP